MLSYEEFKDTIKEHILSYMPDSYAGFTVSIQSVLKVNEMQDVLELSPGTEENPYDLVMPRAQLDAFYEEYKESGNLESVILKMANMLSKTYDGILGTVKDYFFETAKNRLVLELINRDWNKELLESVPYRPFLDLAVICRIVVGIMDGGFTSVIVNEEILERMGLTENELFEAARRSIPTMCSPVLKPLATVVREITGKDMPEAEKIPLMYVLTTQPEIFGASAVLNEAMLHDLAEKLKDDLYLLPASIREMIVLPASDIDSEPLAALVKNINEKEQPKKNWLSHNVYKYLRKERTITMAGTDWDEREKE